MTNGSFEDDLVHDWFRCLGDNAWCSLHYESPAMGGIDRGEISGGGYVRRRIHFSEPASRTMWSLENVKFVGLNANKLTHFGVWNHKNAGKLRAYGELIDESEGSILIAQGGGFVIRAGDIALSLE